MVEVCSVNGQILPYCISRSECQSRGGEVADIELDSYQTPLIISPLLPNQVSLVDRNDDLIDLVPQDRELLRAYLRAPSHGAEHDRLLGQIQQAVITNFRQDTLERNGWQSASFVSYNERFIRALNSVFGERQAEELVLHLFERNLPAVLTWYRGSEIDGLMRMPASDFAELYHALQTISSRLPNGTAVKNAYLRRLGDLENIAIVRNLDLRDYEERLSFPGISDEIRQELSELHGDCLQPEQIAANLPQLRERYRQVFEHVLQNYFLSASRATEQQPYRAAINDLFWLSRELGYSVAEFDEQIQTIADSLGVGPSTRTIAPALSAMNHTITQPIIVGPAGLPSEVREVLQTTGYYDFVAQNLQEIALLPRIDTQGDTRVDGASGLANPGLRRAEIMLYDQTGCLLSAREIAMALIHETAHVNWDRNAERGFSSTMHSERFAFLIENQFAEECLRRGLLGNDQTAISGWARMIVTNQTYVQGINYVFGYERDNYDPYFQAALSSELLHSRGLRRTEDLNLTAYPDSQALIIALEQADSIIDQLELPVREQRRVRELFAAVLRGEAIQGNYSAHPSDPVMRTLSIGLQALSRLPGGEAQFPSGHIYFTAYDLLTIMKNIIIERDTQRYLAAY
jgi:hypothetical protein